MTQRISLMMYKHHIDILPYPIDELFITNNSQHNYNTRQCRDIHLQIGRTESVYKLF